MSKEKRFVVMSVLLVLIVLAACSPKPVSPQTPTTKTPVAARPTTAAATPFSPAIPAWQVEWDQTAAAAKREGTLTVASAAGPTVTRSVGEVLRSRFGVSAEWLAGSSSELGAKILAQRRAGLRLIDMIMSYSTPVLILKPAGASEPLDKAFFLPELTDPNEIQKVWRFGLEWADKEHSALTFATYVGISVVVNTQLVKPGEIKSFRDLLDSKWKGKIVMHDPSTGSGPGPDMVQALGDYTMGWDYVRKLAEQEPVLTWDSRLQMTWLAQGKYPIAMGARAEVLKEFLELGAPMQVMSMEEGSNTSAGTSAMGLIKDAPHPSAAKLYINWLLSKEGQTVNTKVQGVASNRMDVSTEGIASYMIPDPKRRYFFTATEKALVERPEAQKKIREIFKK